MTRTSTCSMRPAPTGWISPSCSARRSLACTGSGSSPTSSSTSVPPSASAKNPRRAWVAPVKAPRVCPNSSASASSPGIAAQLKRTSGPLARLLSAWISAATSSLPVPVSPRTSTASCRRCFASSFRAKSMAGSSSTRRRRANGPPLLHRKRADHHRAAALLALILERAAVLPEGGAGHRHAQAGPLLAGGEEGRAHPLQHLARHAAARVAHFHLRHAAALDDLDHHVAAAPGGIERVGDQVEERFAQPAHIRLDCRLAGAPQRNSGGGGLRSDQFEHFVGQRAQRHALSLEPVQRPREGEVFLEDGVH